MHAIYLAYIQRHPELRNYTSLIGREWEMINGHCRPVHYTKVSLPEEFPPHSRKEQMSDCSESVCESDSD